jgi:hypothetical protein
MVIGLTITVSQTAGTYRDSVRERASLSICRSHVTILLAIGAKDFMKCHRIMNDPAYVKHLVVTENITFRISVTN